MSSAKKEEYRKYLKSTTWKKKRIQALAYHGAECACCGSTDNIHIHHISYLNYPGNEKMTDLIPLCEDHHQLVHKLIAELRERNKNIPTYKYISWEDDWLKASKEAIKAITSTEYKRKPKKKVKKKRVVKSKRKKTKKPKLTRNQRKASRRKKEIKKKKEELKSLNHTKEPFLEKEQFDKLGNDPEFKKFAKKKK
jgi:hypothetical protein